MTTVEIRQAVDAAYSSFESVMISLAHSESACPDELHAEIEWIRWRKRYIALNKSDAYLERVAKEIDDFTTKVQQTYESLVPKASSEPIQMLPVCPTLVQKILSARRFWKLSDASQHDVFDQMQWSQSPAIRRAHEQRPSRM